MILCLILSYFNQNNQKGQIVWQSKASLYSIVVNIVLYILWDSVKPN